MEQNQSNAPKVISKISMITSVIGFICAIMLFRIGGSMSGSPGSATAVTGSVAIMVTGIVFLSAGTWVFSLIGTVSGFIMLIVNLVTKRTDIVWIPVTAVILGVVSLIISVIAF